jgi:lipid II isoglutaminyl synthase (glutamine-hydrolysing)
MKIRVGHLYPDYLNIYADRGNIAVLSWRARARGHELVVRPVSIGDSFPSSETDLVYIGGGQDREQALVAGDLAGKGSALRDAAEAGMAFLGVCGGYQLLGGFYRDRGGIELPGVGVLPVHTVAGDRRMIGDVLLDCEWAGKTLAGFENHAGRTYLTVGAEPLGRVVAGFGNDGDSGYEGCRRNRAYGTYLHGPLLPRNGWFADRLLEAALAYATGEPHELAPLVDEIETEAHAVAAERARARGGRF